MFQRSRARIVLAVALIASLTLVTLDFRSEDGVLAAARDVATSAFSPFQGALMWLVSPVGDGVESVQELARIRTENAELRARVSALEERRRTMEDVERENAELRGLLEMRDATELETVTARTVALSPSNFEWTITIDAGTDDGVDRDMPVVNGDGLVGRVLQATPNSARVLLAIDPNFSAASRTAREGEVGTLDGRGGDPMLLRLVDPLAGVEEGDDVVTSSYQGGLFPAGIPIGTVTAVTSSPTRLGQEASVNPFVDFTRLDRVLVVRTSRIEPIPPFESTGDIEFVVPEDTADTPGDDTQDDDGTDASSDDASAGDGDGAGDDTPAADDTGTSGSG